MPELTEPSPKPSIELTTRVGQHDTSPKSAIREEQQPLSRELRQTQPKDSKLQKWADLIAGDDFTAPEIDGTSKTINLSRFGLKNAKDVVRFLESPAGKTVLEEIAAEISLEKAIEQNHQLERREHALLMHRIKAALALWFIEEETHASSKMKEIIAEQIQKKLHPEKSSLTPTAATPQTKGLQEAIANYTKAQAMAEEQLGKLGTEEQNLLDQIALFDQQEALLLVKYQAYQDHLEHFELSDTPSTTEIEQHIAKLSSDMNAQVDEMSQAVEMNDETRTSLNILNSLYLKLGTLKDMLDVHAGNKHYAGADGETTTTDGQTITFKNAAFILSNNQKIVKDQGKYYLLEGDDAQKDFSTLTDDEKNKAHQHFELSKDKIMSVQTIVKEHKELETKGHRARVEEAAIPLKLEENSASQLLVRNQINMLQAARANAELSLRQPNLGQTAPRPTPSIGTASVSHKPNLGAVTVAYRAKLESLKSMDGISSRPDITSLIDRALKQPNLEESRNLFKTGIANMRGPMPPQLLAWINKNPQLLGISASLGNTPAQTMLQKLAPDKGLQKAPEPEPEPERHRYTPFNMKPPGF